jgi:hypothetical protein
MTHASADPYPPPVECEYREYIDKGIEPWAVFGFSVLDFDGLDIFVRYIDENGSSQKEEQII